MREYIGKTEGNLNDKVIIGNYFIKESLLNNQDHHLPSQ